MNLVLGKSLAADNNEIPFAEELEKGVFVNIYDYECFDTGRRFNMINGHYIEVNADSVSEYLTAMFGEFVLKFKEGRNRIQEIRIIYARVMKLFDIQYK